MKEFTMIFRSNLTERPAPEQMQKMMDEWRDWMAGMAAQDQLANQGNRLSLEGRTIKPGNIVTDGPYVELKEAISGYTVLKARSLDEAVEIAKGCPILRVGGSVEVKEVIPTEM